VYSGFGTLRIWARGVLIIACDLNLSGKGRAGGNPGATTQDSTGRHGAMPAPVPPGSMSTSLKRYTNSDGRAQGVSRFTFRSRPATRHSEPSPSSFGESPTVRDGRVIGAPAELSGSGGAGGDISNSSGSTDRGDRVSSDTAKAAGGRGGRGAGGLETVGRPGSGFSGNGRVVLSGEDGELGAYSTKILGYSASGAGGAHGV